MKFDFKPRLTSLSRTEYSRRLRERGAKFLGAGAYSTVYQHPTKKTRVMKVGKPDDLLTEDGYYAFVKRVVQLHKRNPFLPRVHSIKVFKRALRNDAFNRSHEYYYVVELEKLVKFKKIKRKDRNSWYIHNIGSISGDRKEWDELSLYTHPRPSIRNKALKQANKVIKRISKGGKFFHDVHNGNFMWRIRSTGTHVVFVDPIA